MNGNIAYSPKKDDLFSPCKNAQFVSGGVPQSDLALCAEMARWPIAGLILILLSIKPGSPLNWRVLVLLSPVFLRARESRRKKVHIAFWLYARTNSWLSLLSVEQTKTMTDLADDINALKTPWERGGQVHAGFAGALAYVRPRLEQALKTIPCRMLFTGHSLGAALATLLASVKAPNALDTFAQPLVGDSGFVAILNGVNCFRYVDCCDIVTRIPPEELGYQHVGEPYYIAQDRGVTFNPGNDFIKKDRLEAFYEYPCKYEAWKKENVGARELADHAPVNYVSAVTAARPPV